MKSTVTEIRERFDADVERFSSLETGQAAAPDSPLCMDLVTEAAAVVTPNATAVLDIGCGAGNYTLKLLDRLPGLDVTLLDLSRPMLDRAAERVTAAGASAARTVQGDVRETDFADGSFDVILAAAVLHHLRDEAEWHAVFAGLHRWLRPGGSVWIVDLIQQATPATHEAMWGRYGEHLIEIGGIKMRDKVFAYIDKEDTPRPLVWQLRLLEQSGFDDVDVLHKRLSMAAFGGRKA